MRGEKHDFNFNAARSWGWDEVHFHWRTGHIKGRRKEEIASVGSSSSTASTSRIATPVWPWLEQICNEDVPTYGEYQERVYHPPLPQTDLFWDHFLTREKWNNTLNNWYFLFVFLYYSRWTSLRRTSSSSREVMFIFFCFWKVATTILITIEAEWKFHLDLYFSRYWHPFLALKNVWRF